MSARIDAINAFAQRLQSVDQTVKVITSVGNPVSEVDKKNRFLVDGAYRAFEVTCEGSSGVDRESAAAERAFSVVACGYFSYANDGSKEAALQQLCGAIEDEFDPIEGRTFAGQFSNSEPVQIEGPTAMTYAGILVYVVVVTCKIKDYPRY